MRKASESAAPLAQGAVPADVAALLTRADLEREFGVNPRAVLALVNAGILPKPVRMGNGRTSKMLWRRVDCHAALCEPRSASSVR